MGALVLILLFLAAAIAVASTAVLALGSLLAHIFAVTTFDGALVVLASAALATLWLGMGSAAVGEEAHAEVVAEPAVIFQALPLPTRRSRRPRKP